LFDDGPSTHIVRARIIDKDGGYSEYSTSVTVKNVAPTLTAAANNTASEGSPKSFDLGSFSDPGADSPWTVDVNWGDSSSDSFTKTSTGSIGSHSHTYDDNGTYTVTVKVTDKDGGSDAQTFKVRAAKVARRATLTKI